MEHMMVQRKRLCKSAPTSGVKVVFEGNGVGNGQAFRFFHNASAPTAQKKEIKPNPYFVLATNTNAQKDEKPKSPAKDK